MAYMKWYGQDSSDRSYVPESSTNMLLDSCDFELIQPAVCVLKDVQGLVIFAQFIKIVTMLLKLYFQTKLCFYNWTSPNLYSFFSCIP